jgi:hypothetical protein
MKRVLALALGLALGGPVAAQEAAAPPPPREPQALEILKKVDAAAKAVNAVRYAATARPSGIAESFVGAAEGEGVMVGWAGFMPERFYTRVKTTRRGSTEAVELTGGGNGQVYFLIDHTAKKAYVDMDPLVLGSSANTLRGIGMIEFVHDAPFDDELNAEQVRLVGEEAVGGVACFRIDVVYGGGAGESTWFFAKSDYLPRKRIRRFSSPEGEGAIEQTLTELEVDPRIDPAVFEFKLPAGYQQVDDFAP